MAERLQKDQLRGLNTYARGLHSIMFDGEESLSLSEALNQAIQGLSDLPDKAEQIRLYQEAAQTLQIKLK